MPEEPTPARARRPQQRPGQMQVRARPEYADRIKPAAARVSPSPVGGVVARRVEQNDDEQKQHLMRGVDDDLRHPAIGARVTVEPASAQRGDQQHNAVHRVALARTSDEPEARPASRRRQPSRLEIEHRRRRHSRLAPRPGQDLPANAPTGRTVARERSSGPRLEETGWRRMEQERHPASEVRQKRKAPCQRQVRSVAKPTRRMWRFGCGQRETHRLYSVL